MGVSAGQVGGPTDRDDLESEREQAQIDELAGGKLEFVRDDGESFAWGSGACSIVDEGPVRQNERNEQKPAFSEGAPGCSEKGQWAITSVEHVQQADSIELMMDG